MTLAKLLGISFVAIMGATPVARLSATEQDKTPVAYFSERMPADINAPNHLPSDAKDVVIAKVRLTEGVSWLGGRDQSGEPPRNLPKDIFFTRVKVTQVRGSPEGHQHQTETR